MPGETLPPVVAVIQGDVSDLVSKVGVGKKAVKSMDGVTGTAHIGVDSTVTSDLELATTEIRSFGDLRVNARVGIDQSSLSMLALGIQHSLDQALAGAVLGKTLGSTNSGGGGLLSGLGWGGGLFGFAAFGSVLSLMGAGFEHFIATAIGLVGSLAGAIGGLGVLALGVFGKMAVGMGSDMLVMSSTLADTKTFEALYQQLANDVAVYGKNSAQAATDQAALNAQMIILGNTAGVAAEMALARSLVALNTYWDQATSAARVAAVNFIAPFLSIAYTYIPLIANAATRNFGIMTQAFQPLISWLNGPAGTGIFQNLENLFAQELPTGVSALTQFVELLMKMANFAAPMTGGLMAWLNTFLTYLNTPTGFAKVEGVMTTLVGMFHDWWDLLKQIAITIVDLFKPSAGLGTSIVTTLTQMLKSLDAWLTSTTGSAMLSNVFTVHKTEVLELLGVLGTLLSIGAQIYLVVIPPFVTLANILLKIFGFALSNPVVDMILGWGAAAIFLASQLNNAYNSLKGMAITAANMGIKLLNLIPGVNIGTLGGVAGNTAALDANTGALTRLTEALLGRSVVPGGGGPSSGGGGGLFGLPIGIGAATIAGIALATYSLVSTRLGPQGGQGANGIGGFWQGLANLLGRVATPAGSALTGYTAKVIASANAIAQQTVAGNLAAQMLKGMGVTGMAAVTAIMGMIPGLKGFSTYTNLTAAQLAALHVQGGLTTAQLKEIHDAAYLTKGQLAALALATGLTVTEIGWLRGTTTLTATQLAILEAQTGLTAAQIAILMTHTQLAVPQIDALALAAYKAANPIMAMAQAAQSAAAYFVGSGRTLASEYAAVSHSGILGAAAGGPVLAGVPYIVGENGPELRVFGSPGSIIPNGQFGGSMTFAPRITINGTQLSAAQLQASVMAAVNGAFSRLNQQLRAQ
ncbi:MAG: hypothetical protein WBF51_04210 [Candidatus Dormiibacterota bacterium]